MIDAEDRATRLLKAYQTAILLKDVDRMIALYDDDVRVFDAWGVWVYEGARVWRQAIERWFGSLKAESVNVGMESVRVVGGSQLVVASAIVTFAAVSPAGNCLRSMQNRMTWTLAQRDGSWKIVHEHSSAPIGFDDLKAILHPSV